MAVIADGGYNYKKLACQFILSNPFLICFMWHTVAVAIVVATIHKLGYHLIVKNRIM